MILIPIFGVVDWRYRYDAGIGWCRIAIAALERHSRLDPLYADITCQVDCDVNNTLTGPNGAFNVFGLQKGDSPEQVLQLERELVHYDQLFWGPIPAQAGCVQPY